MSIPKEPRQQMINIMYLVLTALLALNVSSEVLSAFKLVTEGIENTNITIDKKNTSIYDAFKKQMNDDPKKTKQYNDLATLARQYSTELNNYIATTRTELIELGGGYTDGEVPELKRKDDIDVPTRYFIEEGKGKEMKDRFLEYREKFLDLLDQVDPSGTQRAAFEQSIPLNALDVPAKKGQEKKLWEVFNFYHVPLIATNTILVKFQNDVKSTESAIIEYLIKQIGASDFKVDKLAAKIIAPSSYIQQGQPYSADIFVAAYSSTQSPEVYIGAFNNKVKFDKSTGEYKQIDGGSVPLASGYQKVKIADGMGKYSLTPNSVGEKKYSGVVKVKNPKGGGFSYFPFSSNYSVAASSVVVSPDKMNVFYIGVANPVSISVPGFKASSVSATITDGTLVKAASGYVVNVKKPGKAYVQVNAKDETGKTVVSKKIEFRVKRIPDPQPTLGGVLTGGKVERSKLAAQSGVIALLKNFDFEAKFKIVSYDFVYSRRGEVFTKRGKGPLLNQEMKNLLKKARSGDYVFFDNIKVKGPDGASRKLPSLVFEIS